MKVWVCMYKYIDTGSELLPSGYVLYNNAYSTLSP